MVICTLITTEFGELEIYRRISFELPALFDIAIVRFPFEFSPFSRTFAGQEHERKSAGNFKFPEPLSEYDLFVNDLCFRKSI